MGSPFKKVVWIIFNVETAVDWPEQEGGQAEHAHYQGDQEVKKISSFSHQQSSILNIDKTD